MLREVIWFTWGHFGLALLRNCLFSLAAIGISVQSINLIPQPWTQLFPTGWANPLPSQPWPVTTSSPHYLSFWRLPPALYLLHVLFPAPVHITDRNVSWRFLLWSLLTSLATWYPLTGRWVSGTVVFMVNLIGRLGKIWHLEHHLRIAWALVHFRVYSLLPILAYFSQSPNSRNSKLFLPH